MLALSRAEPVAMGLPMRRVVANDGSPFALDQRFELNHEADDPAAIRRVGVPNPYIAADRQDEGNPPHSAILLDSQANRQGCKLRQAARSLARPVGTHVRAWRGPIWRPRRVGGSR